MFSFLINKHNVGCASIHTICLFHTKHNHCFTFARFALDLVEVYFQIVHTRIPLLNPDQIRKRLNLQPGRQNHHSSEKPVHPALVATVLAWGAKFSEHPLLVADRRRPGGQSSLARTAIDRARELAEAMKVHRVASTDHVVIGLLIEPLQNRMLLLVIISLPST